MMINKSQFSEIKTIKLYITKMVKNWLKKSIFVVPDKSRKISTITTILSISKKYKTKCKVNKLSRNENKMHRNFTVEMNILNIQTTNFLLIKIYFKKKKTIQGLFATEVQ